ncbi:MAG TPA: hypothetical protein VMT31_01435 [Methanomicrobiales archaeon]|nr:hypothetical protein [Methanomicrobiales archaeon]
MEEIRDWTGNLLAMVVRGAYRPGGVEFVSPPDHALQLAVSHYPKGRRIRPHVHSPRRITVGRVEEVVHVRGGRVAVDLYGTEDEVAGTVQLAAGDTIFLAAGGHGFSILEDTDIVEVKQGPYAGSEADKRYL